MLLSLILRLTSPGLEHSSFLCGLPDDSINQLLQQHDNCQHQHHHHEQLVNLCHSTPQRKIGNSTMEDIRNPVFHTGQCQTYLRYFFKTRRKSIGLKKNEEQNKGRSIDTIYFYSHRVLCYIFIKNSAFARDNY